MQKQCLKRKKKMSNNKVMCTCSKCIKKGKNNIGNYVHPTTKWRHVEKAKKNYNLELNYDNDVDVDVDVDDDDDSYDEVEYIRY